MQSPIKVILVDDVQLIRYGFWLKFRKLESVEVIAEAENGKLFIQLLHTLQPDIVFMDIKMPVMDGLEATKRALKISPLLKIIALTNHTEECTVSDMMLLGAKGFLLKSAETQEIVDAIETVMNGGTYISSELETMTTR